MFDLETLRRMNAPEPSWREAPSPLDAISRMLQSGPPSISYLIGLLEQGETLQDFLRIVREFVPEAEAEIMANDLNGRIQVFVQRFGERYFPLHEAFAFGDEEDYYPLIASIPIPIMGFSWDDYHELDQAFDQGTLLLMALVASPFSAYGDEGSRIPLLEHCAGLVGRELIARIPAEGYHPQQMHEDLDGTEFAGAALFSDWLWGGTETIFMDVTYEMENDLQWERETVDELTINWVRVMDIRGQVNKLVAWLEEGPRDNFKELLDALGPGEPVARDTEGTPLIEIFAT